MGPEYLSIDFEIISGFFYEKIGISSLSYSESRAQNEWRFGRDPKCD
jgi:hypothetical protein